MRQSTTSNKQHHDFQKYLYPGYITEKICASPSTCIFDSFELAQAPRSRLFPLLWLGTVRIYQPPIDTVRYAECGGEESRPLPASCSTSADLFLSSSL
jgi:hypothetical protein